MIHKILLLLILGIALISFAPTTTAQGTNQVYLPILARASRPRADHTLFFISNHLYSIRADGTMQTQLTPPDLAHPRAFALSPNGDAIVFESLNHEIYVMSATGENLLNLSQHLAEDSQPTWSPDGSKITFVSTRDGNAEIYSVNPDGSALSRLTNNPLEDSDVRWAPDGSQILFTNKARSSWGGRFYIMNPDGSDLRPLTNQGTPEFYGYWSPDSQHILLSYDSPWADLYLADPTTARTQLLFELADDLGLYYPTWSPDSTKVGFWIAYLNYGYGFDIQEWELFALSIGDGALESLVHREETGGSAGVAFAPAWSPDSQSLVFSYEYWADTGWGYTYLWCACLYHAQLGESGIPTQIGYGYKPVFSPGGEYIAIGDDLAIMGSNGSSVQTIAYFGVQQFAWQPR